MRLMVLHAVYNCLDDILYHNNLVTDEEWFVRYGLANTRCFVNSIIINSQFLLADSLLYPDTIVRELPVLNKDETAKL